MFQNNLFFFKFSILLLFMIIYYILLMYLISYILYFNLLNMKYISELKANSISYIFEFVLITIFLSLSGLPPFSFFFIKYILLANMLLGGSYMLNMMTMLLLFLSWYVYFSSTKSLVLYQEGKLSKNYTYMNSYSSFLSMFIYFNFFFSMFGFFFIKDLYIFLYFFFV